MEMSKAIASRAPWAVSGYVMGLEDAWKADRDGWISNVDERRRKPEEPTVSGPPAPVPDKSPAGVGKKPRSALVFGLGLGSLLVPLPIGIAAVWLGVQDKMEQSKGRMEPSGWTMAGIVLGIIGTLVQGLTLAMMMSRPPR